MDKSQIPPAIIVIFGITGDLAERKLLPALYHLMRENLLHLDTQIVGVSRQNISAHDITTKLEQYAATHERISHTALRQFRRNFHLVSMDLSKKEDYILLRKSLDSIEKNKKSGFQRLYYLSIPPAVFDEVVTLMGEAGMHLPAGPEQRRPSILVEKPFGYDLKSAQALVKSARKYFEEYQVYRIDHYLAKESAQNILDFRFRNPLFESIWNRQHIRGVTITAHETVGIEGRANFYEQTGALRDLMQSHMLQLLCLVAMERPDSLISSASIHRKRLKLLKDVKVILPTAVKENTIRGQYDDYREEVRNAHSMVETYAAIKLDINNERWKGVPFVLRTGKGVKTKSTCIDVYFEENVLSIRLQPDEGISLSLKVKKPGHGHEAVKSEMDFSYSRTFPNIKSPEAYEKVLLEAIRQDQTLFATSQEVVNAWRIIDAVLSEWSKNGEDLVVYPKGSDGPVNDTALRKLLKF